MKDKAKKEENPMFETADQAMKSYEQALHAGLKLQEEAWNCWSNILKQYTSAQDWQKYFADTSSTITNAMPGTQRRMSEGFELLEKNAGAWADLTRKAMNATQAPTLTEGQARWMEFWKSSMGLARENAEAVLTLNSRAINSWVNITQKNAESAKSATA